jgi:hypothetical protein
MDVNLIFKLGPKVVEFEKYVKFEIVRFKNFKNCIGFKHSPTEQTK